MVEVKYELAYELRDGRKWYIYITVKDEHVVNIGYHRARVVVKTHGKKRLESMNPPDTDKIKDFEYELKMIRRDPTGEMKKKVEEITGKIIEFIEKLKTILEEYDVEVTRGTLELFINDAIKKYNKMDGVIVDVYVN